jgi:hypothetical protein
MKRILILLLACGAMVMGEKLNLRLDCENDICTKREAVLELDIPAGLVNVELELVLRGEGGAQSTLLVRATSAGTWSGVVVLAPGRNDVLVTAKDAELGLVGEVVVYCQEGDARGSLEATGLFGIALDSFAASELDSYINPEQNTQIKERAVGGITFDYRLAGNAGKGSQLWVYGRAMHGLRSAGVNCGDETAASAGVCIQFDPTKPNRTLYMIRASTSLEALLGVRWEIAGLQKFASSPAAVYLKGQAGFVAVAGSGGSVMGAHAIAVGAIVKAGAFTGSYLDVGVGKTALFPSQKWPRVKVDAYLQWPLFGAWLEQHGTTGFAEITVDSNPRKGGADSVQSYFGVNFDLRSLF